MRPDPVEIVVTRVRHWTSEAAALEGADTSSRARRQVQEWFDEGQDLVGQVIPALLEEYDRFRQSAESAEAHTRRLSQEIGELRSELALLRRERAETADALLTCLAGVARILGEERIKGS